MTLIYPKTDPNLCSIAFWHALKDAPHTEACAAAATRAPRAIFLTGTPSLSRPYDLYRQVGM
jgi:hypothetical protein